MGRNQLVWGAALLLIGGLMLASEMGVRLPNGTSPTDLFWPIALLGAGVWVLVGVFFRGQVEMENISIDLQGASSANVKINHGAGELKIHSGANVNELAHGSFSGGLDHKANRDGDRLEVKMRPVNDFMKFPFFGANSQINWDLALNANIPIALDLNLGANKSVIDLTDMNITDLDLDTGASDTKIILPAGGRFRADLDLGAASLEVIVPEGLSARIRTSMGAADFKINESRFPRNGSVYQSPDFNSAENAVDMTIDAGAASIRVI
ncbi:MAG: hypothetical protein IPJ46_11705 [Anaerolineales bacterium]|nr:hypothetical protein [Anaerolineales bacterium]